MIFKTNELNTLKVMGIEGKVDILVSDATCIEVNCDNAEVPITQKGNCIVVGVENTSTYNNTSRNTVVVNGNSFSRSSCVICTGNGNVTVNGKSILSNDANKAPKANVIVKVPKNILRFIDLSYVGNCFIDGVSNKLNVDLSLSVDLLVKKLENLNLDVSGNSKVTSVDVKKLYLDISGQSGIIASGVESLRIDASGQSTIEISGNNIEEVALDMSGMGNLIIRANEIEDLSADLSGMCNVTVQGKVLHKSIDKSGMCSCKFM